MATAGLRRSLAGYAALVRVPNLFTAPPDVLAGVALGIAAGAASPEPATVVATATTSVLIYAAGTTLNDYFDADVDAAERPERPIPSGRVARSTALTIGATALLGGIIVALFAGVAAAAVAALLATVVVSYDGILKGSLPGFLAMGTARGLNVGLGVATVEPPALPPWLLAVPVAVTLYIAAVTAMAGGETTGGERRLVVGTAILAVVAALVAPLAVAAAGRPLVDVAVAVLLAVTFLVGVGRPLRRAYDDPTSSVIGAAVGSCILGLVVLDGAVGAAVGARWALLTLTFLVPAVALSTMFDVS